MFVATDPPATLGHPAAGQEGELEALRDATLGEYEILAEVGRGGMATVYLAHDLALDRKVAIKVLSPLLVLIGEGMVERFKREARTAASLSHPHVIPIYAVKDSGQLLYFVMKFVAGRVLDSVISEIGPLPIRLAQAILSQVGDALGYAHRHGIIHRDIKAANIMLDEEGWAVVTDFGIAKLTQAEGLTATGATVGTPYYMSPEQCASKEVTGASDQYSLGVLAYEMLTGKPPFSGNSVLAVMNAHLNEIPRPIVALRPDCPPAVAAAVTRMLEKDPAKRWPSMDDVVAAIGVSPLTHDDPARRQMMTLAKSGSHSQLLARLKTLTSPIPPAKRRPRPSSPPESARRWRVPKAGWGVALAAIGAALWWLGPWRARETPPGPSPGVGTGIVTTQPPAGPGRVDTVAVAALGPADSVAGLAPAARPPPSDTAATPARGAPTEELPTPAAPTPKEDSLVRALQVAALDALRRALDAGAGPSDVAKGDTAFRAAESLAAQGRLAEAVVGMATAASLWSEAERLSRTRRTAPDTTQRPAAAPAAPPAVGGDPVDPRAEIEKVIVAYARALESLDLGAVRSVHPGLTAAEQQAWNGFFGSVRNLKAALTVTQLDVAGVRAEAIVSGTYDYEIASTGRVEHRPVTFHASLEQHAAGWRLTSIR